MHFTRRLYLFCGMFGGMALMLLLLCGQKAPACSPMPLAFAPASAAVVSILPPPPLPSSGHWEASGIVVSRQAALSRDRLTPPHLPGLLRHAVAFHFHVLAVFPHENHHIPSLQEIRGMLPFSLAPPAFLS